MPDLQQFQILAQLVENMEIASRDLEKAYQDNNGEAFNRARGEILDAQNKLSIVLR